MGRLQQKYLNEIVPTLIKELEETNPLAIPRVLKIVVSVGVKEAAHDEEFLKKTSERLAQICGQVPKVCKARKSIASFKLGIGNPIGLMVNLRGERMYSFMDKVFSIVLPQVRDFRGISRTSFDGRGNYTLGIQDQSVFPEIEFLRTERAKGLEITVVTNAKEDKRAERLLELLGAPFKKE